MIEREWSFNIQVYRLAGMRKKMEMDETVDFILEKAHTFRSTAR